MNEISIESPNNWLKRAGTYVSETGKLIMPIQRLLIPMHMASQGIVALQSDNSLENQIRSAVTVAVFTRIADTAYFRAVADLLLEANKESGLTVCHNCLRGHLWKSEIRDFRERVNASIIHKMENGDYLDSDDIAIAEPYYESMFDHPLTNPISWGEKKGIPSCNRCKRENKKKG